MPRFLRRYFAEPGATAAAIFLLGLLSVSLLAPAIAALLGVDPFLLDPAHVYAPPSPAHPLGGDDLGRDVLARLLYGGRVSLAVGLAAAIGSVAIGGTIGLLSGYYGGVVDAILMRITEAAMALPRLPLLMLLAAVDLEKLLPGVEAARGSGASVLKVIAVIALLGWTTTARLARAAALQLRETDFVAAARALGASDRRILLTHVLPNAAAPIIVSGTLDVGDIIVYETALSFLGLGVQPPTPSWGALLAQGFTYLYRAPLLVVLPGLLTFLTVAAINRIGDGIRDALDPRLHLQHARRRAIM